MIIRQNRHFPLQAILMDYNVLMPVLHPILEIHVFVTGVSSIHQSYLSFFYTLLVVSGGE